MSLVEQKPADAFSAAAQPVEALVQVPTHVTPWGFLVALPLAAAFAYVGALALDAQIVPLQLDGIGPVPFWASSAILLGLGLLLFLIGIAELAHYLKPTVALALDRDGVTTWGVLGARRSAWNDLVGLELSEGQLTLRARGRKPGSMRDVRLQFNRLAIAPAALLACILQHRPDLVVRRR